MSNLFPSPPPVNPQLAQAFQKALTLHQQGKLDDAEKAYKRILQSFPDQFDTLHMLGMVHFQRGRLDEAQRLLNSALRINPAFADLHSNIGMVLASLGRLDESLASFERAVALEPNNVQALNNRGRALIAAGRAQDALASFDRVLVLQPSHPEARINRANVLFQSGAFDDAIAEYDKVSALHPGHPGPYFNRGNALFAQNKLPEAIASYEKSLEINGNNPLAWNARGVALQALRRNPEAIESFQHALKLKADYADAHFNMGLSLLTIGDYPRGFFEYEWRWTRSGMPGLRKFDQPLWDGEAPLQGKTILLHAEQGLGDTVQFARYVPILASMGARIILEVQPELTGLLSSLKGAAQIVARGETPPAFDTHCPLGRLPLVLKTTVSSVPADIPYLTAPAEKVSLWRDRLADLPGPRIAITWAGNIQHANDRNRSLPLAVLKPLLSANASFVSLQRDLRPQDSDILATLPHVRHAGSDIQDFCDTAAIAALCDLVISVDTSVAHIAGATGRPLWVMIPFAPDWRWTLDQEHSPWYPQARLFRQPAFGDWASVVGQVAAALQSLPRQG